MSDAFLRTMTRWVEAARTIGFFFLLVLGSGACGLAIAWPLWLFATTQRKLFTIFIFCIVGAGIITVATRALFRRRRSLRDPGKPPRPLLSVLLTILLAVLAPAGAYLAAALFYRGFLILAIPALLIWAGLLWTLGHLRGATMVRKEGAQSAENRGE